MTWWQVKKSMNPYSGSREDNILGCVKARPTFVTSPDWIY